MPIPLITSLQNPRVKLAAKLRDSSERKQQGRIIIDGLRETARALEAGVEFTEVFVCEPLLEKKPAAGDLLERLLADPAVAHVPVAQSVMEKLAFGDRAEGILAVARTPQWTLANLKPARGKTPLYAVVEGVEKPGNLGAILRTADAAGVSGVIVADGGTDLYNPNAIRASLGAIFTVPVCTATSAETLGWLRLQQVQIFVTRVTGGITYAAADFSGPCAMVLGSESQGLTNAWCGDGVAAISLPMLGSVDSLNLSATAAILFYEALRQRNVPG